MRYRNPFFFGVSDAIETEEEDDEGGGGGGNEEDFNLRLVC